MANNSEFGEKAKGVLNLGLGLVEIGASIKLGASTLTEVASAPLEPTVKVVTLQGPEAANGLSGALHALDNAFSHAPNGVLGAVGTVALFGEGVRRTVVGVNKLA